MLWGESLHSVNHLDRVGAMTRLSPANGASELPRRVVRGNAGLSLVTPHPLNEMRMAMTFREKVTALKEMPARVERTSILTLTLSLASLIISFVALFVMARHAD
jgi:hypothetical protein